MASLPYRRVTALRLARVARGVSQRELALACLLTRETITQLELGRTRPHAVTKEKIAQVLGFPESLLFPERPPVVRSENSEAAGLSSGGFTKSAGGAAGDAFQA